jgi:2-haloacid dehalogenase
MAAFLRLACAILRLIGVKAYPDVPPAIQALSAAAIRLGFLSNLTEANIKNAGLEGRFEQLLSTDRVQAYKSDPRAYQMGIDALGCQNRRSSFAPLAAGGASGAKSFGYETCWANRLNLPVEELGVEPDAIGGGAAELAKFATRA